MVDRDAQFSPPSGELWNFEFAALSEARNYRAAIADYFSPHLGGDILEVGAGVGQMLADVISICRPRSAAAVEPDSRFLPTLKAAVPTAEIWEGSESDIPNDRRFDAIYAINVLEHIFDDEAELIRWHRRIKPDGNLCILVPARPELYAPIDADFGHHRRYTKRELKRKLTSAGFVSAEVQYFNLVGYFAWLINFRLLKKRTFSRTSVRFFDRVIFPGCRSFESMTRVCPFGQSLVAVAKI